MSAQLFNNRDNNMSFKLTVAIMTLCIGMFALSYQLHETQSRLSVFESALKKNPPMCGCPSGCTCTKGGKPCTCNTKKAPKPKK
jgi:hypothetical protein